MCFIVFAKLTSSCKSRDGPCLVKMLTWMVQARGKGVDLRVTQISPGVVETEFDVVMTYGKGESSER